MGEMAEYYREHDFMGFLDGRNRCPYTGEEPKTMTKATNKATVVENVTINGKNAVTAGSAFRVAGTQFANDEPEAPHRQAVIAALKVGDVLECRREPSNPFDTNAVAFYAVDYLAPGGFARIGFMPAPMAADLAEDIDGGWFIAAQVTAIKPNRLDVLQVSVRLIEWLDAKK